MGLVLSTDALNRNIEATVLDADMATEEHPRAVLVFMENCTFDYKNRELF
jgi:hypothetical protein